MASTGNLCPRRANSSAGVHPEIRTAHQVNYAKVDYAISRAEALIERLPGVPGMYLGLAFKASYSTISARARR